MKLKNTFFASKSQGGTGGLRPSLNRSGGECPTSLFFSFSLCLSFLSLSLFFLSFSLSHDHYLSFLSFSIIDLLTEALAGILYAYENAVYEGIRTLLGLMEIGNEIYGIKRSFLGRQLGPLTQSVGSNLWFSMTTNLCLSRVIFSFFSPIYLEKQSSQTKSRVFVTKTQIPISLQPGGDIWSIRYGCRKL